MPEVTRTVRQWVATLRRTGDTAPALAARIRRGLVAAPFTHPEEPRPIELDDAEAAALERLAPLGARWMPPTPGWALPAEEGRAVAEAADAFVRAHQRRSR